MTTGTTGYPGHQPTRQPTRRHERRERESRPPGFFWPVVLIGVGVVWLLYNLGFVSGQSAAGLLRYWPILLVVAGLDLMFGRRAPVVSAALGILVFLLMVALVLVAPSMGLGLNLSPAIHTGSFVEPLEGVETAQVNLYLSAGAVEIRELTAGSNLMEADLTYVGAIDLSATGGQRRTVTLRQRGENWNDWVGIGGHEDELRWKIGLNPSVPLDLRIYGGLGSSQLDLSALHLSALRLESGAGSAMVNLPARAARYSATLIGGLGSTTITVPERAAVDLTISGGAGSYTLRIGKDTDLSATLEGGLGSVRVDVPSGAAVRVEAELGIGGIHLPDEFVRVQGNDRDGVWQTPNYTEAEHRIEIKYEGGVGSLNVE